MSADVYTLASPSPTLYAYPSQLHPTAPPTPSPGRGGSFWAPKPRPPRSRLRDDDVALAVLGAI